MLIYLAALDSDSDRELFEWLYSTYKRKMWYVAKGILHDESMAENAVHDVFCKVVHNSTYFSERSRNENARLIVAMVRHTALDILKREKRMKYVPEIDDVLMPYEPDDMPEFIVVSKDQCERLLAQVGNLDERQQNAIMMKWAHGLTNKEIAALLGVAESTVRSWLFKARRKLNELMKEGERNESEILQ